MKKIILIALIGILFLSMVYAYTPVPYYSANLTLTMEYTPVPYYSANLTLGEEEPPVGDNCTISIDTTFTDEEIDCSGKSFIVKNSATANFINSNLTADIISIASIGGLCYQETANVSTACGGLNTGNYSFFEPSPYHYYFLITYYKPNNVLNSSYWQYKIENSSGNYIFNQTIPSQCWNAYSDYFSIGFYEDGDNDYHFHTVCDNGTDYYEIKDLGYNNPSGSGSSTSVLFDGIWTTGGTKTPSDPAEQWYTISLSGTYVKLYEEAMWWNLTSGSKIIKDTDSILTIG